MTELRREGIVQWADERSAGRVTNLPEASVEANGSVSSEERTRSYLGADWCLLLH